MRITVTIDVPKDGTTQWEDLKQTLQLPPATEPLEKHRVSIRNKIVQRLQESLGNVNIQAS